MVDETNITLQQISQLSALALGIIPGDDLDAGAASVHAGPTIAAKIRLNPYAYIYLNGLADAERICQREFGLGVVELDEQNMEQLMTHLRDESPDFFRQLRADVCLIYLSDPGVWQRIGFPGASAEDGGYPDFDQPQQRVATDKGTQQ